MYGLAIRRCQSDKEGADLIGVAQCVLWAGADPGGAGGLIGGSDAIRYLFTSNPAGRFTSISKTDGAARIRLASHDCDARGDLARATDAAGQAFGYAYDRHLLIEREGRARIIGDTPDDLLDRLTAPDGTSGRWDFNGPPLPVRRHNPAGARFGYHYDVELNLTRLTNELAEDYRLSDDLAEQLVQEQGFDGHLIAQDDGQRRHSFRRDPLGRLVRRDSSDDSWAEYGYDLDGGFQQLRLAGHEVLALSHDRMGRETRRDADGPAQQTDYDPQGRIRRQQAWRAGKERPVFSRDYRHDANGRVQRIDDLIRGARDCLYDRREQLRRVDGATPESFHFDPAGNIAAHSWDGRDASVQAGRLMMRGDCHYDYDDAGNRIAMRRGHAGSHVFRHDYGAMNQLIAVHEERGRTRRITEFRHDALGRRIQKHHREMLQAANDPGEGTVVEYVRDEVIWFLWDDMVLLAEGKGDAGAAGDPLAVVYVHEPGSFRPLAQIRRHAP